MGREGGCATTLAHTPPGYNYVGGTKDRVFESAGDCRRVHVGILKNVGFQTERILAYNDQ